MDVLGLPGRDEATEAWLAQVIGACDFEPGARTVQRYQCWDDGAEFDLAVEVSTACTTAADLVVAKSMGTRVAIHSAKSGSLAAREFVLIGIPLAAYADGEIGLLGELCDRSSVLIIQQTNDFLGGFQEVRTAVGSDRAVFEEVPGEDHVYSDVVELGRIVRSWKARSGSAE